MKLRIVIFPFILLGLIVLAFSAGRGTCACGDTYAPPEPIVIQAPAI